MLTRHRPPDRVHDAPTRFIPASDQPPAVPCAAAGSDVPPPDTGVVASSPPGIVTTPDGWILTVAGLERSQLPVAPLTTARRPASTWWAAHSPARCPVKDPQPSKGGTLEAGYQVGCGIELGQVRLIGSAGIGTSGSSLTGGHPDRRHVPALGHHRDPR